MTPRPSMSTSPVSKHVITERTLETLDDHHLTLYGLSTDNRSDADATNWLESKVADLSKSLILLHFRTSSETVLRSLLSFHLPEDAQDEAADLRLGILASLYLHNRRAPVNRLPTEVLSQIFWEVVHDFSVTPQEANKWLIQISSVCRQWRDVSFGHPTLWSFIFLDTRLTNTFVTRSQDVLVDFTLDKSKEYTGNPLTEHHCTLFSCADRVRSIALMLDQSAMNAVLSHLPSKFPALQSLRLICLPSYGPINVAVPDRECIASPGGIMNCRTPSLRRLFLSGMSMPWTSSLFSGLTHLEVLDETDHPTIDTFLDALDANPSLEELHLHSVHPVPLPTGIDMPILRQTSLPHLRDLSLQGTGSLYTLSLLRLPPTTCISLPLFRYIPTWHAHLPSLFTITTLELTLRDGFPTLYGTSATGHRLLECTFGPQPIVIFLWIELTHLTSHFGAHTLRIGHGTVDPEFSATEWAQGLSNLRDVRTLALHSEGAFRALDIPTDPPLCPLLEDLELGQFALPDTGLDLVRRWTHRRRTAGVRAVHTLRLADMRQLEWDDVERLETIIPTVLVVDRGAVIKSQRKADSGPPFVVHTPVACYDFTTALQPSV